MKLPKLLTAAENCGIQSKICSLRPDRARQDLKTDVAEVFTAGGEA